MTCIEDLFRLLRERGHREYGGESVTQLEHALQTASLAERAGEEAPMILAALLHDVGHFYEAEVEGATPHEDIAAELLRESCSQAVSEVVRLHVDAKRYLVATCERYASCLSAESTRSLARQGAAMDVDACARFEAEAYADAAIRLRKYDDAAKIVGRSVPTLDHFERYVEVFRGQN